MTSKKKLSYSMFSTGDNIGGYSFQNSTNTLSYLAYDSKSKKSSMYIRNYDGKLDYSSQITTLPFSSGHNLRGLEWHKKIGLVSYIAVLKGKTNL